MMESLSPLERAVLVLRRGFNWPYEEFAEMGVGTGVRPGG
jgi:DNA-directed RNA polymerase specialized sigma24 family protein